MNIIKELFGKTSDGTAVNKYTISNKNGTELALIEYGASIQSIVIKDKNGVKRDVTVGFVDIDGFENRSDYQGVIAGPYANRIGGGKFTIDGVVYDLDKNEDGIKTLHGCGEYTHRVWKSIITDTDSVEFSYTREDGKYGYPGEITAVIKYTLGDDDSVTIKYFCTTDKKTYINPTNHTYFNLGGFDSGDILSHKLKINADEYIPVDETSIPTGGSAKVENTPFDFREFKEIGKDINEDCIQLKNTGGYDHNFCIKDWDKTVKEAAVAVCDDSGITLTVSTDLPGVQFYAGNFLKGIAGKDNLPMNKRCGFCLETQYYPDTPNHPEFPSCLFDKNKQYSSTTVFAFTVEKE